MSMIKAKPSSDKQHQSAPVKPKIDPAVFDIPQNYRDHTLRRLRESYNGDWWLNVDYVSRH